MVNTQGLTVGLAVGVPSFVIITVVLLFWLRNQRKQNKEDSLDNEIDMDLRDDQPFNQFQEELHRPYNKVKDDVNTYNDPSKSSSTTHGVEYVTEKPYVSSNGSSSSSNTIDHSTNTFQTPPRAPAGARVTPNHYKTASAYDFYETFIPILPQSHTGSPNINSSGNTVSHSHSNSLSFPDGFSQPPALGELASTNNSSNTSLADKNSLDNLAKQLAGPTFFEKLPSRAAVVSLKPRYNNVAAHNNSSSDLVHNTLVGETALNDNFIYEANTVDVQKEKAELHRKESQRSKSTMSSPSKLSQSPRMHRYSQLSHGSHVSDGPNEGSFDTAHSAQGVVDKNVKNDLEVESSKFPEDDDIVEEKGPEVIDDMHRVDPEDDEEDMTAVNESDLDSDVAVRRA
ncbi:uncharacterized protein RJT20DRAFT_4958 [Scheffersomyces xylosifermentans]|uniref:uncharacterized protein n=1 Tax=Scheffersomyces xylosifermentans TaxID=1304137 RepID=UPI00315D1773